MHYPRSSPGETRWAAFILGFIAFLVVVFSSYSLARSEITGDAIYSTGPRGIIKEPITRKNDPAKFRAVIDGGWFVIMVSGGFSLVCFYFFRKLS